MPYQHIPSIHYECFPWINPPKTAEECNFSVEWLPEEGKLLTKAFYKDKRCGLCADGLSADISKEDRQAMINMFWEFTVRYYQRILN